MRRSSTNWGKVLARTGVISVIVSVIAVIPGAVSWAAWSISGAGAGAAASFTMPTGLTPSGSVSSDFVSLSWSAATFPDGTPVAGYLVSRINASTGSPGTVGGSCAGVVAATSCVDSPVPVGNWVYTVTPVQLSWTGGQSPGSNVVTVRLT